MFVTIFKQLDKQFIIYIVFAILCTLLDFFVLFILKEFFDFYYLFATIIGYVSGMFLSYFLNKVYNFKNKNRKLIRQFTLFAFVSLTGLGLTQLVIWSLVEFAHFDYRIAKVISIFIVFFSSFYGHKKITFSILK